MPEGQCGVHLFRSCFATGATTSVRDNTSNYYHIYTYLNYSYVQSLLAQLERLKENNESSSGQSGHDQVGTPSSSRDVFTTSINGDSYLESTQLDGLQRVPETHVERLMDGSKSTKRSSFDQHSFLGSDGGSSKFFGSSSGVILTANIIRFAIRSDLATEVDLITSSPTTVIPNALRARSHKVLISSEAPDNIQSYVATFLNAFGAIHGIVDGDSLKQQDVPSYLLLRPLAAVPGGLQGLQMYQYFDVSMICAIGCATNARHQPSLSAKSLAFFEDVLPYVEEVTSAITPQSLQSLLLLVIFSLFWPTKVDVWRLLDYCCRLSDELGYHVDSSDEQEDEAKRNLRRTTFWGLYTLEGLVSQIFGRSPDLNEAIITTRYPDMVTLMDGFGATLPQYGPISMHHRLMHIRFEIFKDLYVPAESAPQDLDWYQTHFHNLQEWKTGFETIAAPPLLTVSCNIFYHSTICFLFQKSILEAMEVDHSSSTPDKTSLAIPQDNYWSACELIKIYESIIRARQESALGEYPMTFISVHFICIACMTILSHALLALSGRDQTRKMVGPGETSELGKMDFRGLWSASNSALLLLSWCSERWPGAEGMLNVYKRLADVIIPAMFRKGMM